MKPLLSFGCIVLNGEEFIKQSIASVYDHAHEIIVIDGATPDGMFMANPDGSSTDNTKEIVRAFGKKVKFVSGKWADKNEQSNAYMKLATGDMIWQIDSDEAYKDEDIETVRELIQDRNALHVSFTALHFWHNFKTLAWGSWWSKPEHAYHRINKFYTGALYAGHRPPTIYYNNKPMWEAGPHITAKELEDMGIYLYHYSHVTDRQVKQKMQWYANNNVWKSDWYERVWKAWEEDPAGIELKYGTHPSNDVYPNQEKGYTKPFTGTHPKAMRTHPLYE